MSERAKTGGGEIQLPAWLRLLLQLLGTGVIGSVFGVAGKWLFDRFNKRLDAERAFADKVTDSVIKLANEHYWRLATVSGVLARLLQETSYERALHLVLPWPTREALAARLDNLANRAAERSFPHFVQAVSAFQKFQFDGSNTYLLRRHAAGEDCKRLYNAFLETLSQDLHANLEALHAGQVNVARPGDAKFVWRRVADLPPSDLPSKQFQAEREMWRRWLRNRPDQVQRAADALRAYHEILLRELADLHEVWLRRAATTAADRWSVLSERSRRAIAEVGGASTLYLPLGGALQDRVSSAASARAPFRERATEDLKQKSGPVQDPPRLA